jgi:hypothetical protein
LHAVLCIQGEYRSSNNRQDDMQVMQRYIPLLSRFTSGNTIATAVPLDVTLLLPQPGSLFNSSTAAGTASGVISRPDQVDVYVFEAGAAGEALVSEQGLAAWGDINRGNLDTQVTIEDAEGVQILPPNDSGDSLGVTVNVQLPAAGVYYLKVQGTGYKDFRSKGYSAYGSLGQYMVTVKFPVAECEVPSGTGELPQPSLEAPSGSGPTLAP